MQPDGKVVASSRAGEPASASEVGFLTRYNSDGSLDASFGTNGRSAGVFQLRNGGHLALQDDGKLILLGTLDGNNKSGVARFTRAGALDSSFGPNGDGTVLVFPGPYRSGSNTGLALSSRGKIVVVGNDSVFVPAVAAFRNFGWMRVLNSDGSFDTSFDDDSVMTIRLRGNEDFRVEDVQVDSNDKYVISGRSGDFM